MSELEPTIPEIYLGFIPGMKGIPPFVMWFIIVLVLAHISAFAWYILLLVGNYAKKWEGDKLKNLVANASREPDMSHKQKVA